MNHRRVIAAPEPLSDRRERTSSKFSGEVHWPAGAACGVRYRVVDRLCELSLETKSEISSTSCCGECDQHIGDPCYVDQKESNSSKSHKIVLDTDDVEREQDQKRLPPSYCDQHTSEELVLFCYDCNIVLCLRCVNMQSA